MAASMAEGLLRRQFAALLKSPDECFTVSLVDDNVLKWEVCIVGPPDTPYENGVFCATLDFPESFPMMPPVMRFTTAIFHPNVYEDGSVCISILHPPNSNDWETGDNASERWLPIHTVESIVLSVISMLADPNDQSPANVEAAKLFRTDRRAFERKVRRMVESQLQ